MNRKKVLIYGFLVLLICCPIAAFAQTFSLDLSQGDGTFTSRFIQFIALLTVITLAPSILIMVTSFTRIIVVLSFLRSALGLQQSPPNPVLMSLALFLTAFVMAPTFEKVYDGSIQPLMKQEITEEQAWDRALIPVQGFMIRQVREKDLGLFMDMANLGELESVQDTPMRVLIPAFMLSELRRAFEIGFLLFVPFLIIDMVVASVLMSMGMMMLPPVTISLPFKLVFFVLVDGWYLVAGSLVQSFGGG